MSSATVTQPEDVVSPVLDTAGAAKYLGVSEILLRQARAGTAEGPPFYRHGRAVRYRIADIDAWIEARLVKPKLRSV